MEAAGIGRTHMYRTAWLVLLRAIAAILFGVMTLTAPRFSGRLLILAFGAYAFINGALLLASGFRRRGEGGPRWMLFVGGLAGVVAGLVAFFLPGAIALGLLNLIAAWAVVTGAFEVVAAIRLRKVITGEWLLALSGIASIVLGVLLIMFPRAGAMALVLWIGAYELAYGVLLFMLGLRLRRWERSGPTPRSPVEVGGGPTASPRGAHAA